MISATIPADNVTIEEDMFDSTPADFVDFSCRQELKN
jgi:hypothetical protein